MALNGVVKLWTFDSDHGLKSQSTIDVKEIEITLCFILEKTPYGYFIQ